MARNFVSYVQIVLLTVGTILVMTACDGLFYIPPVANTPIGNELYNVICEGDNNWGSNGRDNYQQTASVTPLMPSTAPNRLIIEARTDENEIAYIVLEGLASDFRIECVGNSIALGDPDQRIFGTELNPTVAQWQGENVRTLRVLNDGSLLVQD